MNNLLKFFPFLPEAKNVGKLVLALLFYGYVPVFASGIVMGLGITVILAPPASIASLAILLYGVAGVALSILKYMGIELPCCKD